MVPSCLKAPVDPSLVKVESDGLTAVQMAKGLHKEDYGVVQANHPIPIEQAYYYFELTVMEGVEMKDIMIGLAMENYGKSRLGQREGSIGFNVATWEVFANGSDILPKKCRNSRLEANGSKGKRTFGCGLNVEAGVVVFTSNGDMVTEETFFAGREQGLYPSASMHFESQVIILNFGRDLERPFVFDFEKYVQSSREKMKAEINGTRLPNSFVLPLIKQYLCFHGFSKTLERLNVSDQCDLVEDGGNNIAKMMESTRIDDRDEIRRLIMEGKPLDARERIQEFVSDLLESHEYEPLVLDLECQHFIEIIRSGDVDRAVQYARTTLARYCTREAQMKVSSVLGLIAFRDPVTSPLAHLLHDDQRRKVWSHVNSVILQSLGEPSKRSGLELCLKQLTLVEKINLIKRGGRGKEFNIDDEVRAMDLI